MSKQYRQIRIELDIELHRKLRILALQRNVAAKTAIQIAIVEWVGRQAGPTPEAEMLEGTG